MVFWVGKWSCSPKPIEVRALWSLTYLLSVKLRSAFWLYITQFSIYRKIADSNGPLGLVVSFLKDQKQWWRLESEWRVSFGPFWVGCEGWDRDGDSNARGWRWVFHYYSSRWIDLVVNLEVCSYWRVMVIRPKKRDNGGKTILQNSYTKLNI